MHLCRDNKGIGTREIGDQFHFWKSQIRPIPVVQTQITNMNHVTSKLNKACIGDIKPQS